VVLQLHISKFEFLQNCEYRDIGTKSVNRYTYWEAVYRIASFGERQSYLEGASPPCPRCPPTGVSGDLASRPRPATL